jgi:hypothetical protein
LIVSVKLISICIALHQYIGARLASLNGLIQRSRSFAQGRTVFENYLWKFALPLHPERVEVGLEECNANVLQRGSVAQW